ncbi:MAG: hypothetical protein ABI672_20540, partial [Vicinamibacteria bacterium]
AGLVARQEWRPVLAMLVLLSVAAVAWQTGLSFQARPSAPPTSSAGAPSQPPMPERSATPPASGTSLHSLRLPVADAAFSRSLNRIVFVATQQRAIVVVEPETGGGSIISIVDFPRTVVVSPDGTLAMAVGEAVTLIDLTDLTDLSLTVHTPLVIPGNGQGSAALMGSWRERWPRAWAYVAPAGSRAEPVRVVDFFSQRISAAPFRIPGGGILRVHPNGGRVYLLEGMTRTAGLRRFDVDGGRMSEAPLKSANAPDPCGNFWISDGGNFASTACGATFALADDAQKDLEYLGTLPGAAERSVISLEHSEKAGRIFVITDADASHPKAADTLMTYEFPSLKVRSRDAFPALGSVAKPLAAAGRFVFVDASGTRLYVLLTASDGRSAVFARPLEPLE